MQAASRCIQQVHEASCSDLSWGLKHDEGGDISKPSGEDQEIDIDLMSSHTSTKTTRNTTQNALPHSLRHRPWNELERAQIGLLPAAQSKVAEAWIVQTAQVTAHRLILNAH